MNEVMRRSACCLLSALLLCSCVGCANSVHEISEGDAAQSSSKNDDAAEQAYKAFTVDALDRIAADDLNSPGGFLAADQVLGPTPRPNRGIDQFGAGVGFAERGAGPVNRSGHH